MVVPTANAARRTGRPTRDEATHINRAVREAARRLFLDHGYDATSMAALARAAGTTKASLYVRFPTKELALRSTLEWAARRIDTPPAPPRAVTGPADLAAALTTLAHAALDTARHPDTVKLERLAVAEAARFPDLTPRLIGVAARIHRPGVAALLRAAARSGIIRAVDPNISAGHFLAMVQSLPAAPDLARPDTARRHIDSAVELLLGGLCPTVGTTAAVPPAPIDSPPNTVAPAPDPDLPDASTGSRTPAAPERSPGRRLGESRTRKQLLDATARVMLSDGFAAATSRRIAAAAGVRPALVHYYFPTMDDLLVAVLRRGAHRHLARQHDAVAGDRPLQTLWQLHTGNRDTALILEFMAMAGHRPAVRAELASYTERSRAVQQAALTRVSAGHDPAPPPPTPAVTTFVLAGVARLLVWERALGISAGHADVLDYLTEYLPRLDAATVRPGRP